MLADGTVAALGMRVVAVGDSSHFHYKTGHTGMIRRVGAGDPVVRWDHSGEEHQSSSGKLSVNTMSLADSTLAEVGVRVMAVGDSGHSHYKTGHKGKICKLNPQAGDPVVQWDHSGEEHQSSREKLLCGKNLLPGSRDHVTTWMVNRPDGGQQTVLRKLANPTRQPWVWAAGSPVLETGDVVTIVRREGTWAWVRNAAGGDTEGFINAEYLTPNCAPWVFVEHDFTNWQYFDKWFVQAQAAVGIDDPVALRRALALEGANLYEEAIADHTAPPDEEWLAVENELLWLGCCVFCVTTNELIGARGRCHDNLRDLALRNDKHHCAAALLAMGLASKHVMHAADVACGARCVEAQGSVPEPEAL